MTRPRRFPLYLQLYLALLVAVVVALVVVGVAFRALRDHPGAELDHLQRAGSALEAGAPDPRAPNARDALDAIAEAYGVDLIVGEPSGLTLASSSRRPFAPPRRPERPGFRNGPQGPLLVVTLDDDRWGAVRARHPGRPPHRIHPFFVMLFVLAGIMGVASYPFARRVTRRLELLTTGVERWGKGELGHRVQETGADEVATLAAAFNRAAERIDVLLLQQKQMLANASHELRSPLARLRMGLELVAEEPDANARQKRVEEIRRDIVELDSLIEEVLLYARADARVPRRPPEPVALGALVSQEAARAGVPVAVSGDAVVPGDVSLLRHLVRNLMENAVLHGGGRNVRASITTDEATATLAVEDDGPGIPEADRERVFAPFYRSTPSPGPAGQAERGAASGHGVGLALVRQVARHHGGDARCTASASGGSRFEITLPVRPSG